MWQPIETAPKDGTFVLITGGHPGYGWDGPDDLIPPCVVASYQINHRKLQILGGWQFAVYEDGYYGVWENPTHWMPLPAGNILRWNDMASAPRNGTKIFLVFEDDDVLLASSDGPEQDGHNNWWTPDGLDLGYGASIPVGWLPRHALPPVSDKI